MTKINNAKALDLIRNSSGRFISITGIKKNGEIREYKSSIYNQDMYNNLNVLTRDGYRNINPNTILTLKANKQTYQVS
tara:strand:- start:198 stop:431 length:234 start_codon:yes stop_codon:yes gene_type:complete